MSEELDKGQETNPQEDKLSTGLQILSFCIPLAGAIIYFTSKERTPNKAKKACHAALWGMGLSILLQVIATVIGG